MNARERLRLYLEQRREIGESELILDGLPVDDVMSMLDARTTVRVPRVKAQTRDAGTEASATTLAADSSDAPSTTAPGAAITSPAADEPRSDQTLPSDVAPIMPTTPEPPRRFDEESSTDWRETLRRAGAMKPPSIAQPFSDISETHSAANNIVPPRPAADNIVPPPPTSGNVAERAPNAPPSLDWLHTIGVPIGLTAGVARSASPAIASAATLDAIAEMTRACTRCDLYRTALNPVPGEGNPEAEFVCVGEAPGQSEDEQGVPFVGAAGALLNKILGAIQLQRDDVFICNVLKHRPPGNRDPLPEEVVACEPYLRRQLELVRPRVILALGRFAAQSLLETTIPIGKLRGQLHQYHGIPLIVTYHPAALLRNEAWKRPTWEDVKLARRVLDASRVAMPLRP